MTDRRVKVVADVLSETVDRLRWREDESALLELRSLLQAAAEDALDAIVAIRLQNGS